MPCLNENKFKKETEEELRAKKERFMRKMKMPKIPSPQLELNFNAKSKNFMQRIEQILDMLTTIPVTITELECTFQCSSLSPSSMQTDH